MSLPVTISWTSSTSIFSIVLLIFIFHGGTTLAQLVNIGAIVDVNSRTGKEEKIAMAIAVQDFNNGSNTTHKVVLHVCDSSGDPLRAFAKVNDLIKQHRAQAIVGMDSWQETVLAAKIATQSQVPVISFVTPAITPPLTSSKWPFLLRMANNDSLQMKCLASIISSYGWRKIIVIYEDDSSSTDSLLLPFLSNALREVGSEIEHWSVFPPFSTISNPDAVVRQELEKLLSKQSRVFIIVRSSLHLVTHAFPQAKQLGLMGRDSVWITTDSVTNLLDAVNNSVLQSMQGVIGIKTYFSQTAPKFKRFSEKFRSIFHQTYPEEDKFEPGIHALRGYDAISTITRAIENPTYNRTSNALLQSLLGSSFSGLSGEIRFNVGELSSPPVYQIVNVIGKSYNELNFWSSESGFYDNEDMGRRGDGGEGKKVFRGRVHWPGGLERVPQGWVMPKPLKIGVPGRTSFEKFVKVKGQGDPTGFCIDVFKEAVKLLSYDLPPPVFVPFPGKYDDLVDQVYFKNFDAVVGDITILANRTNYVEFSQPYAESGLSLVVPVKSEEKTWLFVKPFTKAMWLVTGSVFVYTMFVVWFLEHRSNPDFKGPWKTQLSTALWFTFSTLFFAHRERLSSNYTRVVIVVWLFIVFVVTSSYTASLTSMLTVQRLEPTVTDIQTLKWSNSLVGCDGDSFVRRYLEQVLDFHPSNIINIKSEYDYPDAFNNGTIKAAFLELPYKKVFLSKYCNDYRDTGPIYKFGGLGFVFPKGSPLAVDISEAILKLSEHGTITKLEKYWFKQSSECSDSDSNMENGSLSLQNFWTLYLVTSISSTIMLVVYIAHLLRKYRRHSASPSYESFWNRIRGAVSHLIKNPFYNSQISPIQVQELNGVNEEWISSTGDCLSGYITPGHPTEASPTIEIQMPETVIRHLNARTQILSLASFPGGERHVHSIHMDDPETRPLSSRTSI